MEALRGMGGACLPAIVQLVGGRRTGGVAAEARPSACAEAVAPIAHRNGYGACRSARAAGGPDQGIIGRPDDSGRDAAPGKHRVQYNARVACVCVLAVRPCVGRTVRAAARAGLHPRRARHAGISVGENGGWRLSSMAHVRRFDAEVGRGARAESRMESREEFLIAYWDIHTGVTRFSVKDMCMIRSGQIRRKTRKTEEIKWQTKINSRVICPGMK